MPSPRRAAGWRSPGKSLRVCSRFSAPGPWPGSSRATGSGSTNDFSWQLSPLGRGPDDQDAKLGVPVRPRHLPDLGRGEQVAVLLADLGGDRRRGVAHEGEMDLRHVGLALLEDLLLRAGPDVGIGPGRVRHVAAGGKQNVAGERAVRRCETDFQRRAVGNVIVHLDRTHGASVDLSMSKVQPDLVEYRSVLPPHPRRRTRKPATAWGWASCGRRSAMRRMALLQ